MPRVSVDPERETRDAPRSAWQPSLSLSLFIALVLAIPVALAIFGIPGKQRASTAQASARSDKAQTPDQPPDPASVQSPEAPAGHAADEQMAASGIESLPPITVKLNGELLRVLKMTDALDALWKRGCSSMEFFAAGKPVEQVAMKLQQSLPRGDPRRDLLVNTIEGYQQAAYAIRHREQEVSSESVDALIAVAGIRKILLTKILEGHMTPEEKNMYYLWRKSLTH